MNFDPMMEKKIVDVQISPSEMEAYVIINPPLGEKKEGGADSEILTLNSVVSTVKDNGVSVDIDENAIRSALEEKRWGQRIQVAEGSPPIQGKDGYIKYLFNTDQKPFTKILEGDRVDYYNIGLISIVEKDAALAIRVPAQPGKEGCTVLGKPIPAANGDEIYIQSGPNTYFADQGDTELRAAEMGSVSLVDNTAKVEKSIHLKKGVNFATGNVDFPGDVVITGNVHTGFKVRSGGKIEVSGLVEDAEIEAEGDVLVKGGFTGSGKGKIKSKGDVFVKFIENQIIEAEKNVYVADTCVHGDITANQNVELSTWQGAIIGGHIRSRKDVIVKVLGNEKGTLTRVEILGETKFEATLREEEAAVALQEEKINCTKNLLGQLNWKKANNMDCDPDILEQIHALQDTLFELDSDLGKMTKELNELYLQAHFSGKIRILNKAHPGSNLIFGTLNKILEEEHNNSIFICEDAEIIDQNARKISTDHETKNVECLENTD